MAEESKVGGTLGWLRTAKDKFRAFAYGEQGEPKERPRVGLALAGGFARGIAHIGVLRVLREANIPIDCVAGTSVGALIGAGYCAGASLEEMQKIGALTSFADFGRWTPSWLGLATNQRMEKYLARFSPVTTFEELSTPLAVATTDINAGVSVYYSHGPIAPVVRDSFAYPGLLVPNHSDASLTRVTRDKLGARDVSHYGMALALSTLRQPGVKAFCKPLGSEAEIGFAQAIRDGKLIVNVNRVGEISFVECIEPIQRA